jgi:hypothetical protein
MTRSFEKTGHATIDTELVFSSGANAPSEITALVRSGNNPGVAVCELSEAGLRAIEEWAGCYWQKFFVDSGAFGEVSFGPQGPMISRPIDANEWEKRLAKYDRLAASMGGQVYLVAPDCVAHQTETRARLRTYAKRILGWLAKGANVIVPVQKGADSMADFAEAVVWDLIEANEELTYRASLRENLIWGIPMKKDATSIEELQAFCAAVQPRRIHLLGCGTRSKTYRAAIKAVEAVCPECEVYSDSVRITALVGKTNGKGGGPRAITRYLAAGLDKGAATLRAMLDEQAQDVAAAEAEGWFDPELADGPKGQWNLFAEVA